MGIVLKNVTLDDKYKLDQDRIYVNGIQALVRIPLMQRYQDSLHGLNTAGFISGYRGSPLGGLDLNLAQAQSFLDANNIVFQPGLNEDLAATTVWGSQQTDLSKARKYDGVFGLWYGKGPGVDRSLDAIKHANAAGTAKNGGVLMLVGDDHSCKSSTFPHQSEQALIHAFIPMLNPANIQDILDMGLLSYAMSRYSGLWVGMKCVADTMDSSASVYTHSRKIDYVTPTDYKMPDFGLNIRWPDVNTEQEIRLLHEKLPAAKAFARANNVDKITHDTKDTNLTLIATGKAYGDLMQALRLLKIDDKAATKIGLLIAKIGMVWPLEERFIESLASRSKEMFVLEEKRPLIESQMKEILYGRANAPLITGKKDDKGEDLLADYYELTPLMIAKALVKRLSVFMDTNEMSARLNVLEKAETMAPKANLLDRIPYYCSGCPHNTSTRVPEGSRAMAGIGCHYMATWIDDKTKTYTQMGGEGTPWIGQAPFLNENHIFANLGDGTYQHSGLLAIRASIAAKVNITYKILYNDAVAMTGGQHVEGDLTVDQISRQVAAEGATKIIVMSDDIEKYKSGAWNFDKNVIIRHRSELMRTQKELRETKGTSILIYDQTCAAEKRRRRKRKLMPDPKKRVFINEMVCEGCGDCGLKSNCVSIMPVETEFGRKRQIDQSSCNKDYTCLNGFCPSFVTIEGGDVKKPEKKKSDTSLFANLPEPNKHDLKKGTWSMVLTGIGGTGVVTIGALLAMAAHLEGKGGATMDQIGLAQKGGAVFTYMRFAQKPEDIFTAKIGTGQADVILGADLVVAASHTALSTMRHKETHCILNADVTTTGDFTKKPDLKIPQEDMIKIISSIVGDDKTYIAPITDMATSLMGNSIATNIFLVGYAYQLGLIPLSVEAIIRAIELNNVAVPMNIEAFNWGRLAAHDVELVKKHAHPVRENKLYDHRKQADTLDQKIAKREQFLTDYQNQAYAKKYLSHIQKTISHDTFINKDDLRLSDVIARNLFKLMAYKDEYEVARLYTQTAFESQIKDQFDGDYKIKFHMAPPLFAPRDKETGELKKIKLGAWIMPLFRAMAPLKIVRGTAFDIFGYSAERKTERALIEEYKNLIDDILPYVTHKNYEMALQLFAYPEQIRGFGHVKEKSIHFAKQGMDDLILSIKGIEKDDASFAH